MTGVNFGWSTVHPQSPFSPSATRTSELPRRGSKKAMPTSTQQNAAVTTNRRNSSAAAGCQVDSQPGEVRSGKRGGAYSWGSYTTKPYLLLNYRGTLDNVFTLAHEMGHSMQTHFSNLNQPYIYSDYATFVAEVASTVNEAILIEKMMAETRDPDERVFLLNHYLEQIEKLAHSKRKYAEEVNRNLADGIYALALDPQDYPTLSNMGVLHKKTRDYGTAAVWIRCHFERNRHELVTSTYATGKKYSSITPASRTLPP